MLDPSPNPDPALPAWKLELINNRRKRGPGAKPPSSSASFSHFDRHRPPAQLSSLPPESGGSPTKTKDIIRFFNTTRDVAQPDDSPRHKQRLSFRDPRPSRPQAAKPGTSQYVAHHSSNGMSDGCPSQDHSHQSAAGLPQVTPGRGEVWLSRRVAESGGTAATVELAPSSGEDDEVGGDLVIMGEDKRLFVTSQGRSEVDNARMAGGGQTGPRLYARGRQVTTSYKRNLGARVAGGAAAGGDSDGMLGSGGESDSSEEIHYGPGFVSRLKSRYMSVALRGSARESLGNLRRTASLEDFLDIDKNRPEDEVELIQGGPQQQQGGLVSQFNRNLGPVNNNTTSAISSVAAKAKSKKESMKRAQSVEVLSVLSDSPAQQKQRQEQLVTVPPPLPDTFFQSTVAPPPSESPPPLPPRDKGSTLDTPTIHTVLQSPALATESIVIAEATPPLPSPPAKPVQTKPAASVNKSGGSNKPKPSSNAKKTTEKRPSAGVLFGVREKELPKVDTVRETRKLFEANNPSSPRRFPGRSGGSGLTKSKSNPSLYSRPASRSSSVDVGRKSLEQNLHRTAVTRNSSVSRSPARRAHQRASSPRSPVRAGGRSSPVRPGGRSSPRTVGPSSPNRTSSTTVVARPTVPAKPSHLSPIVSGRGGGGQKVKQTGLVKASPATVVPSVDTGTRQEQRPATLNLQPERGVKQVSQSSVESISEDSHVVHFNFEDKTAKSYLPGAPTSDNRGSHPKQVGVIRPITREADKPSTSPELKPKGALLSKVQNNRHQNGDRETLVIGKDPVFTPPQNWLDNTQKKKTHDRKTRPDRDLKAPSSEANSVILSPVTLPTPSVTNAAPPVNTRTNSSPVTHSPPLDRLAAPQVTLRPLPKTPSESVPNKSPPRVPQRNGSKLEHGVVNREPVVVKREPVVVSREPVVVTREPTVVSREPVVVNREPVVVARDQEVASRVKDDKVELEEQSKNLSNGDSGSGNSYRDNWKARKDQQNSLVFNFVNTKKDVSHIENDGLDLSKRADKTASKGVILLDPNGESCDGEASDHEDQGDVGQSNKFTFIGAEIKTGKSSLRSRQKSKKLSISFNDKTEVFEYPPFESGGETETEKGEVESRDNSSNQPIFKSNTAVGSSGGLGSYTPSKIQLSDSPFQLGVSRTGHAPSLPNPAPPPEQQQDTPPALLPADHGLSWGHAASSDMLF